MYVIYLGADSTYATVNITNALPGETPEQLVNRYAQNNWLPNLPWQDWFEVTGECSGFGGEFLIPNWQTKTCEINQEVYTSYMQDIVLAERQSLLKDSDWSQLPDVPEATKLAWQPYRQALRDVTLQEGYPFNVVWPQPPLINP